LEEEPEEFEFRASPSINSFFGPTTTIRSTPPSGAPDLKKLIQIAISPLISEIKGLKYEIQQLKAEKAKITSPIASQVPVEATEKQKEPRPKVLKEKLNAAASKDIISKNTASKSQGQAQIPATKPTYAGNTVLSAEISTTATQKTFAEVLRSAPTQEAEIQKTPWITIQRKAKPLAQDLAPKKATEPSQRRLVFQRLKDAPQNASLPDMLLAINLAIKAMGLPEHIRLLKLSYTATGSISGLLREKALASMLLPDFSDHLIRAAREHDAAVIGVSQAEQWYRLRVHRVLLSRYLVPQGLRVAKQEIEATQGLSLPLNPQWLGNRGAIKKRYENLEIHFSIIVITVRNKLEADRLIAEGLHFGGFNHTVDRYWATGPEEICPRCGEYGHTSYRGCTKPPRCYICAGDHEVSEH
jgi:hypothetical protein